MLLAQLPQQTPATTMIQLTAFSIKPDQYKSAPYNIKGLGALQATTGNQSAQVLWGPKNITVFIEDGNYERVETAGYTDDGTPIFAIYPHAELINRYLQCTHRTKNLLNRTIRKRIRSIYRRIKQHTNRKRQAIRMWL